MECQSDQKNVFVSVKLNVGKKILKNMDGKSGQDKTDRMKYNKDISQKSGQKVHSYFNNFNKFVRKLLV